VSALRLPSAPSRVHAIAGASNFRDFGRYETARGQPVAAGRLYRSAHLAGLTVDGARALTELGVATVIDLRGVEERRRAPAAFIGVNGVRLVSAPVEPGTSASIAALQRDGALTRAAIRDLMIETYRSFVASEAASFGRALSAIDEAGDRPLLIHCTAGKDRTGFLVALLHALLGVPRDHILADYDATNIEWDRASVSGLALDSDVFEPMLVADADYLDAAFAEIERIDGSAEDFLRRATAGRVAPERLHAFLETGSRS
jgi:protein-tyrosine phosphatase